EERRRRPHQSRAPDQRRDPRDGGGGCGVGEALPGGPGGSGRPPAPPPAPRVPAPPILGEGRPGFWASTSPLPQDWGRGWGPGIRSPPMNRHARAGDLKTALFFLLPNLLGFLLFTAGPVLFSLAVSFSNWNLQQTVPFQWTGLANFRALF